MGKEKKSLDKTIAENRRARYDYEILDVYESGLVLQGSEVKSLRTSTASIAQSYASTDSLGELYLYNAHISVYESSQPTGHVPHRPRKILLQKRQVNKLVAEITRKGMTLVPMRLYFNSKGLVKLRLGLGRGRKVHDKRQREKQKTWQRDKARLLRPTS